MAGSISRISWFSDRIASFDRLFCQEDFIRFYFIFVEAWFDQFIQDLIFLLLVALALIAIDIGTNRWRGLRAETKTAALLIETAIFLDRIAIYYEVLINCLEVDVIYKYFMVGYYYFVEITLLVFPACFVGIGNIWTCWNHLMKAGYRYDDACARNQAMLIYLVVTSLILVGSSAHCFRIYARYYLAITHSFLLFWFSSSKCQF